jgi:serine/threonine protein kinase
MEKAFGTVLNHGITAAILTHGQGRVLKTHAGRFDPPSHSIKSLKRERHVYETIGRHPNILEYYGAVEVDGDGGAAGICLERARYDSLRAVLQRKILLSDEVVEAVDHRQTRCRWIFQVASALSHLHSHSFLHCDVSCRNIVLTSSLDAKLIDFGSTAIAGEKGLGAEEGRYYCPPRFRIDKFPSIRTDIFALGSAMYEILTDSPPYKDVSTDQAERRFDLQQFPETGELGLGDVLLRCWEGTFSSVDEILRELRKVHHPRNGNQLSLRL